MTTGPWLRSIALMAFVLGGSGCTLYQPRPVTFRVRDGDTGLPVAGARVEANYLAMFDFGVMFASIGPREGVTDQDGNLSLVIDPRKYSFRLHVSADGYPEDPDFERVTFGSPRWERLEPGPWHRPSYDYDIRLYRGPQPTADVTIPHGYRGTMLVEFAADGNPSDLNGQRAFSYTASSRGVVAVSDGALFEAIGSYAGVRVREADGVTFPTYVPNRHRPIPPSAPSDDAIALRFITPVWKQHIWLYVLGTAAEAEKVERMVWPDRDHFDQAAFDQIIVKAR